MSDLLYISRLLLSARSRQARAEIARPYELHRTLSRAFHGDNEKDWQEARCLFRIEDETADPATGERTVPVIVQTRLRPDWSSHEALPGYLSAPAAVKELPLGGNDARQTIPAGVELSFRLLANPTIKQDGKRRGIYDDAGRLRWLHRKAEDNGFVVTDVQLSDRGAVRGRTAADEESVFSAAQFDGTLRVTDAQRFAGARGGGIGAGKGFGFGLLTLARPR